MKHRSIIRSGAALVIAAGLLLAASGAALAAPPGNNGTVKIAEGAPDAVWVPIADRDNDPHVCTFHIDFFFSDPGQTGTWSIDQQPPTGTAPSVLSGTYGPTDVNGVWETVEYGLPIGHYSLNWEGRNDANIKQKTFWVTCENPAGPINPPPVG
ncbi:MAG: hypothetical protein ACLQBX_13020 [Candidatus Limnocylindrales bacterium]